MFGNLKTIVPIVGSILGAFALGASGMLAFVAQSSTWPIIYFAATVGVIAVGCACWWYYIQKSEHAQVDVRWDEPQEPRYVMPADIQKTLDEGGRYVAAMADAASKCLDNEMRLREQMRGLAEYITRIEDENEMLRVEAEKVREIQAVAARVPRMIAPKPNPDDYGVRRSRAPDVPEQSPEPLAFLRRDPTIPIAGARFPEVRHNVDLSELELAMDAAAAPG
jgi:hypothetical protein